MTWSTMQRHGENSEPAHEVGDLQEALRLAWAFMRPEARSGFMTHSTIWDIVKENPPHGLWEPVHDAGRDLFCLFRLAGARLAGDTRKPEVKRHDDGSPELFHTKFKAQRRANALNKED